MTHSVTTREAEWDDEERGKVLALLDYESLSCAGCGGYLPETTDPEAEGEYVASAPHRCHRCTALSKKRKEFDEAPNPDALVIWPVERKN